MEPLHSTHIHTLLMSTPELYNTELFKEKTDQTKSVLIRSNVLTVVLTFMSIISLLYVFFFFFNKVDRTVQIFLHGRCFYCVACVQCSLVHVFFLK